ncbi:unnamed protein product [marine sediment metagenome]|uniref:Uncharacterized protein n=1 Tax=marine sediment metagenome TaxID=412755 RepID=X1PUI6_9ZZZZ
MLEMPAGKKMRIEVTQLPPVEYSLNWRGHWAERYGAAAVWAYRNAVYYSCVDARNRALASGKLAFIRAKLSLTFVFPEHRRRDRDNLLSRFKPGLDGIVASGLLVDDDAEHLEISGVDIVVDRKRAPLTVIDLEQM